ncbi:hypothetical protein [Argonema antarcticum]|uniref:hypothetical protein n=1 Tax=Argonema antarcticum TaxID=2942763 RepID=UPI0020126CF1|nr:hypothetical protein [Argonema antarcticum]MCL1473640.1 hypothetical protein [Argonema antarcticum A004/B2]
MTQPSLTEKQLAKLEEIAELVKEGEDTFIKLDEMSTAIAQKWRSRREAKEGVARK